MKCGEGEEVTSGTVVHLRADNKGSDCMPCGTVLISNGASYLSTSMMYMGVLWEEPYHLVCMVAYDYGVVHFCLTCWCKVIINVVAGGGILGSRLSPGVLFSVSPVYIPGDHAETAKPCCYLGVTRECVVNSGRGMIHTKLQKLFRSESSAFSFVYCRTIFFTGVRC